MFDMTEEVTPLSMSKVTLGDFETSFFSKMLRCETIASQFAVFRLEDDFEQSKPLCPCDFGDY
jgi:hypothetical protein